MQWRDTPYSWGVVTRSIHWLMALLILVQMVLGWMAVQWPFSPTKIELFVWHKSLGITALALVLVRIVWRLFNPTPQLPAHMSPWQAYMARAGHLALYALMLLMPISGWIINDAANFPLTVFHLIPMPSLVEPSERLEDIAKLVHLTGFWLLAFVLSAHIGAALVHHFYHRDVILRRMIRGVKTP